ncbi:UNVERIFIED_CONTAM: protein JINGUBANG [Sesamum calycinum]|uniref:Protein JINGUBANG n=1 Tax=Sesamum calycinum TaxID=2727403 RepID=A0AAW2NFK1_9LAMI
MEFRGEENPWKFVDGERGDVNLPRGLSFDDNEGSSSCRVHAWKLPDCIEMGYIKATTGEIQALLACGKLLFTTHGDCRIRAWEMPPTENSIPKKKMTLPQRRSFFSYPKKNKHQHKDCISCLAYNNREKLLFTGSWDQTVKVWKIPEKRCIDSFDAHEVNALALSQSPSASFLYSGSSDGLINFWEKETDDLLLSGSEDATIRIWKREDGKYSSHSSLVVIDGHHGPVKCLAAAMETNESVKGLLVYSASLDQTLKVWQVKVNPVHKTNWDRSEDDNSSQKLQSAK